MKKLTALPDLVQLQEHFYQRITLELHKFYAQGRIDGENYNGQIPIDILHTSIELREMIETAYRLGAINESLNWLNTGTSVTCITTQ